MEFWGVEVKPGQKITCDPGKQRYLHLSQASLGEMKEKGNEHVPIFLTFNDNRLVLGTLCAEKCAQISYDLVFEKEFELFNSSKNTSVYFCGYKTPFMDDDTSNYPDSDADSEDIQLGKKSNGKSEVKDEHAKPTAGKANAAKGVASAAKPKVMIQETNKADKSKADEDDDEEDDDEEDDSEEDESDDDEDMAELEDDCDDKDEDESSDEDEATPAKSEAGKKRPAGSASKTPAPEKKVKLLSPAGSLKTGGGDGKKSGHTTTPHPAKQVGKTPINNDKSKQQTPKSGGSVVCKSCSKTFNSDNALQAHTKAKHSAAK